MKNSTTNKAGNFIKGEVLKSERNSFAVRIITIAVCYSGITFWLNSIRATASLWFVWILIIIQFTLYFSIFIAGYRRAIVCGMNKNISLIVFTALAILGRVNDWELAIIPLTVIIMLVASSKTKNISDENKHLLPKHLDEKTSDSYKRQPKSSSIPKRKPEDYLTPEQIKKLNQAQRELVGEEEK
ncbi:hypothetical protein KKF38_03545 [Patescibacteria group bacterium]|nr:hypothetical protein [Patescibacteria group bacterium]